MPFAIKTEKLTHIYGAMTPFEKKALDDCDFEAAEGEMLGIIGHTGSGKSTLIQHFNGLLKPSSGKILVDGQDIWQKGYDLRSVRFRVGLVFQYPEYQLFEETVYKDIAFGPKNMGLSDTEIKERVMEAIEFAGLEAELLEKSPFELSGGQKRRAAIAGVIAMRPRTVIFDEPTAGLDPESCDRLLERIRLYHERSGATVIIVTHSMEEIARMVSRIIVMAGAKIAMSGSPAEIFSEAERLESLGLTAPQVTKVFFRLRELGADAGRGVYTIEQAVEAILAMKGGAGDA